MVDEEHFRKLERMYLSAPVNTFYQPKIHISRGEAEISVPVKPQFFHAADAVHGVLYFKMLDDASFFAVNSLVDDVFVLTVSFNLYLTRPVSKGTLISRGKVVHQSQRLYIAEAQLLDEREKQIARGSGTFMKGITPLSPEVGYE
ncbi:MAG: hotdog fold thioesterase [Anaerolineales bacterium]|nr:hotdog fold thioesterase [Anaerolineales bacterium]